MAFDHSDSLDLNNLYRLARLGDKAAEQQLMGHLTVSFHLVAQHRLWDAQEAEEVVQEALVTILTKYREVEIETSFGGWTYGVLQNKIMECVRKRMTRRRLDGQMEQDGSRFVDSSDPDLKRAIIDCFQKIHRINNRHARVLNLHYQGYTTEEICGKLDITENNLYVQLSRARRALEICLGKDDEK
jgi:RNA polymerase sigma factor (sigma-70 family)